MPALLPDNEAERLAVLRDHHILDTPPEEEFDDLVRLTAQLCGVPIAAVSLIDDQRQWFKSVIGLSITETSRDAAFCAHTILQSDIFVVQDTHTDPRFADNPLVTGDPHIRFYAGAPLVAEDGYALGSLCVIDKTPRGLTSEQQAALCLLARQVSSHLKTARRVAERERLIADKERLLLEKQRFVLQQEHLVGEREQAEAERSRLAAIVEGSADAIMSTDLSGRIVSWNAGAERLFGYSAAEIIGQHQTTLVPPGETSTHENHIQTVIDDGQMESLEVVRQHKTGERIHISLTLSAICDSLGQAIGVSAVARDITVRKRAEAALEREHEFNLALMESLQEGIVACDADGMLTLFNRATREFHGLPESHLPPALWAEHFDLFHADGITPMQTHDIPLFRALQGETVRNAEMVIAPKDGCRRTLLANGQAIYEAGGKKLGAVVAMHDVTASRKAEQELARLAAIVESSEEAILATTLNGTFISWNKGAERLYGYSAAEMIGQHASVLAGRDQESPVSSAVACLLLGKPIEPIEVLRRRKDGTEFYAALSFSPIRDVAGQMVGLSCIARDITAGKTAQSALAESEARFRIAMDAMEEGLTIHNGDGAILFCNGSAERILGLSADQMMGRTSLDPRWRTVHEDGTDFPGQHHPASVALREGIPQRNVVMGVYKPTGELTWVNITAMPLLDLSWEQAHGQNTAGQGAARGAVVTFSEVTERRRADEALRHSQARLAEAQRIAQIGSWEYDIAAAQITWSDELFRLFGMEPADEEPSVAALMERFHPDDVPMHMAVSNQAMQDGEPYEFDIRAPWPDGSLRWFHAVGCGERSSTGQVTRLFGTLMDITERRLAEERFRVLFEQSSDAHLLLGEGGTIDCNPAAVLLLGCQEKSQLLSRHPAVMSPEFQPDGRFSQQKMAEMEALAYEQGCYRFEWVLKKCSGEELTAEVTLTPVTLADRPVLLWVLHDLTERLHQEQRIKDHAVILEYQKQELEKVNAELSTLATTDGLTGLPNHRTFQDRLAQEVVQAARYDTPLSVVLLDVDHFKQYNDTYGHPAGDDVLQRVGVILQSCARESDLAARYGGEEFVLILPQTDSQGAAVIAERVRTAIAQAHWPQQAVTASLGVASLSPDMDGGGDLIARADAAMYQSKMTGRNRITCDGAKLLVPRRIGSALPVGAGYGGEGATVAVLVSDMEGTFLSVSARACELLGYSEAELVGTSGLSLIHPDDIESQGWRMDDVAAGQVVMTERRVRCKNGTWLRTELRIQRTSDGRAECVLREIAPGRQATEGLGGNSLLRDAGDGFSMLDALLAAVDNKDRYTRQHSEGVMAYALLIAREMGLDQDDQDTVAVAALVHDVGKIGVPDHVLRKAGSLTGAETEAVALHPQLGAAIISAVPGMERTVAVVRHHHEQWSGGGYPDGLQGQAIPLMARLMAVADAFSAMTTDRPYRRGMGREQAMAILQAGAGTQWDPECVGAFLRASERHQKVST